MWKFLLVLSLAWAAEAGPTGSAKEIPGYESCTQPKDGLLNVHIVPHTHDDVGWLKTVDQYYYGSRNMIQKAGVQYIIDSVVKELWEDPKRRFIYVETAFFWKWWNLQPDSIKSKVHTLVTEGRLQFVGGAWSMNDEATTYYQSIIDQFTWGLSKLRDTFGAYGRPRVGWQIDPFGHSREFASLLAAMGYDGLFLGRIDYQDKRTRQDLNTMEMVWRGDDSLGKSSDIFTGVLYNTYSPPPGFCFDVLCADEPIIDDPSSPDYNVDRRVEDFIAYVRNQSEVYRTNNVIVTMGGDFTYQQAGMWYENLDKLIQYGNLKAAKDGKNITLFYSTPNCYLKAVKDATPTLPIKQDDFFPYASDPHAYWTGYFTSRPAIKYLEAQTNTYLQVVKQLQLLGALPEHNMPLLDELKSAMGVLQHHDAVTGTEKQHVTHDYVRMATQAAEDAHTITTQALNRNIFGDDATQQLVFDRCHFNESRCDTTEEATGNLIITVYNPLAWPVISPVQIPVVDGEYDIVDGKGVSQTVQITEISKTILELPSRVSKAKKEVTFIANLPPLGYKSYYMSKKQKRTVRDIKIEEISDIDEYFEKIKKKNYVELAMDNDFDNDVLVYTNIPDEPKKINRNNYYNSDKMAKALLKSKEGKDKNVEEFEKLFVESSKPKRPRQDENSYPYISGDEMRMLADDPMVVERFEELNDEALKKPGNSHLITTQGDYTFTASHWYYPAAIGNNEIYENRSSGAYIFRPSSNTPVELKFKDYKQIDGPLFSETRFTTENNAAFTYRFYNHRKIPYHELDFVVGPINIDDGVGKEFIVRYETNIVTNGEFYTDSNGRQLIKRKLNKRPQYNLTVEEPVAGNYYPVVSVAGLTGDKGDVYLNVLPDRAVGVASLQEGNLEVMLHRRLLHDDAFGVGEALNETEFGKGLVVRGTHRFFFTLDKRTFKDVLEMRNKPQVFVSNADGINLENWKKLTNERSWLKSELPDGVHLLTLEPFGNRMFLLRLENFLEESESSSRVVDLAKLLTFTTISSLQETVLSANAGLHEKWTWNTEKQFSDNFNKEYGSFGDVKLAKDKPKVADDSYKINLAAKQIRTFIARP
ncbi:lysosomal alpha-mannosidase-like isoform X1 [Ostrinia nubilalis]|uniref:lysosomal alpha-mannosidase-like isoform X1 n=1 Tax=Ostrinia nubilalis TaxID=29057 RepID=UPI003082393A